MRSSRGTAFWILWQVGKRIISIHTLIRAYAIQNDQFSQTGSFLGETVHKFKIMAEKESGATMCYLVLFIVIMVILAYYWFF